MRDLRTTLIYLAVSLFIAFFGGVYEYFSHGVWSYWMVYAFAIPMTGGMVPYLLRAVKAIRNDGQRHILMNDRGQQEGLASETSSNRVRDVIDGVIYSSVWHAVIATLTLGSIMKGVLDIYGTSNPLIIGYPVAAVMLVTVMAVFRQIRMKSC